MEEGLSTPVGTRRSFFVRATMLISSVIGFSLAVPIVGYLVSPAFRRQPKDWVSLGKIADIPTNEPTALDYTLTVKDGWQTSQSTKGIWAVKQSDGQITVYSPLCPHLGCGYRWNHQDRLFKCPCHGSVYDMEGIVQAGPAPRPLDRLPSKVENGELLVLYQEFKTGLSEKVEL